MAKQSMREFIETRLEKGLLDVSAGGVLGTKKQDKFMGEALKAWPILDSFNVINNLADPNYEMNELQFGEKAMRVPTQGSEPAAGDIATATITPQTLTVAPGTIYANIGKNWLLRNIEKESAAETINQRLGWLYGADLLNLFWNGNTSDVSGDADFLTVMDGLLVKMAANSGINDYDTNGSQDFVGVVFDGMLAMLSDKYHLSEMYKPVIYMNRADAQLYRAQIRGRDTALGDQAVTSGIVPDFAGIQVKIMPYLAQGNIVICPEKNFYLGVWEKLGVYRQYNPRKHQLEFTLDGQHGCGIGLPDGVVWGRNIA